MSCHFIECFQNQILYFCKTYINILYVSSVILYCIQPAGAGGLIFVRVEISRIEKRELLPKM